MSMYEIIGKKRHGSALTKEDIRYVIDGYVGNTVPDYQMSALLMAIVLNGMTDIELGELTLAMAQSGTMADLSAIKGIKVDKHSTGGVGDKTTLIVAPLVAACGGTVAKMSGRGLGHTGGTIDKMESIPGMRTDLSEHDFIEQVNRIGVGIIGQTAELAPADKKIYALRDVTATVDSIPLIASSIMSKKLASGADAILLDVKVGSGAFMKTMEEARVLARAMVNIGRRNGRKMRALITDMDRPLGNTVGNALEIKEVIETLRGRGPSDLTDECIHTAAHMLALSDMGTYDYCESAVHRALTSGEGLEKLRELISAQGGNSDVVDDTSILPHAEHMVTVRAGRSGYINRMDTERIGMAAVISGAGRLVKDGPIDFGAGIEMFRKTGDAVVRGEPIAVLYGNDESDLERAGSAYEAAVTIGDGQPELKEIILDTIG